MKSIAALTAILALVACGKSREAEPPAAAQAPKTNEAFVFTDADLDAYGRGISKEIELVKAGQQRASSAQTPDERGAALQAQWETATIPEAARAAGIGEERYRRTREAVHEVFKTLDFQGKIDGPLSIDLSRVDPATRAKLSRDPFQDLPPQSAAALRARMDKLVPLWAEYTRLTAVAG